MNQLNVALTRAQDGLVVITDVSANESQGDQGYAWWIANIISFFRQAQWVRHITDLPENPSVPESIAAIQPEDVQEDVQKDVQATDPEQMSAWDPTQASDEGTTARWDAPLAGWGGHVEPNASNPTQCLH